VLREVTSSITCLSQHRNQEVELSAEKEIQGVESRLQDDAS
jgi:hypothetical protein